MGACLGMGEVALGDMILDSEIWPDGLVPIEEMDAEQCLDVMAYGASQKAFWDATVLRAQGRFAALRPPDPSERGELVDRFAPDEVAVKLGQSRRTATGQLDLAQDLGRLPETLTALEYGEIDYPRVKAMSDLTRPLSPENAREVEQKVLAGGPRGCPSLFRRAIRRAVLQIDPEGEEKRRQERKKNRSVDATPHEDGMGWFSAYLTADETVAVYNRINRMAHACASADDGRSMGERRADVLVDLLLGNDREHVSVQVNLTMPVTTLMGLNQHPGELHGYGPIPAELCRELAQNATWRRILTDPVEGQVLEVSRRRFPSAALADHIRMRDRTCRFPGCMMAAESCDQDHTIRHADEGWTWEGNLGLACRHHNLLKERDGWSVRQYDPGHFVWTSPTGDLYLVKPESYEDPDQERTDNTPPPF